MKIYMTMTEFQPWSGAIDTYNRIENAGLLDDFFKELEIAYNDEISETELNDLLRYDPEFCLSLVGLEAEEEE